jgi:hypothetical protein
LAIKPTNFKKEYNINVKIKRTENKHRISNQSSNKAKSGIGSSLKGK